MKTFLFYTPQSTIAQDSSMYIISAKSLDLAYDALASNLSITRADASQRYHYKMRVASTHVRGTWVETFTPQNPRLHG